MTRVEIINLIIKRNSYSKYLEVGVQAGACFKRVKCAYKISVDPDKKSSAVFKMTSDNFFRMNVQKFDLIFVDGLHHHEQVYRDIINSLESLSENGTIVCHDMLPTTEAMQQVPRREKIWTGDCWKAFVQLRTEKNFLKMFTVDCDFGVGIITRHNNERTTQRLNIEPGEMTFKNFSRNKAKWMNLISVNEFLKQL